jgi:hypothetical protein
MSTIDIFGKTTSESGTIKTEGLTLSEADFLFLRKISASSMAN